MSSKLIPPKVGSRRATVSTNAIGSSSSTSISNTSISAKRLNKIPLPSITGLLASAPILPRPNTAVPLLITPTKLARDVYASALFGSFSISKQGIATPGE